MPEKSLIQTGWDFIGIPFRLVLFNQAWLPRFGWTTLEDERLNAVLPHIQGRLLDIGAGSNTLVRRYGNGIGVDVHNWGGGVMVLKDSSRIPFCDRSFDTITLIACLNHIPNRQAVLYEARRLIKPDGRLIITMINPILGDIGHAVWWYGEDRKRGGMKKGEVGGLWSHHIEQMCRQAGFQLQLHRRFVYKMNNLYIFKAV